jgi:hypothetical protein
VPRFYFHVRDDLDAPDDEGAELSDLGTAWKHACHSARSLMCETLIGEGRITLHHCIDIQDEQRKVLATVRFSDAVTVEGDEVSQGE